MTRTLEHNGEVYEILGSIKTGALLLSQAMRSVGTVDTEMLLFDYECCKAGEVRIARMLVTHHRQRGMGLGTKLMELACAEADEMRRNLVLEASPYDNTKANQKRLIAFYEKFNFRQIPGEPTGVLRRCFTQTVQETDI